MEGQKMDLTFPCLVQEKLERKEILYSITIISFLKEKGEKKKGGGKGKY